MSAVSRTPNLLPLSGSTIPAGASSVATLMAETATVLCVDDEETILLTLKMLLESVGFRVLTATSAAEALKACQSEHFHATVLLRRKQSCVDTWEMDRATSNLTRSEHCSQPWSVSPLRAIT